jgi:hypothetical protein
MTMTEYYEKNSVLEISRIPYELVIHSRSFGKQQWENCKQDIEAVHPVNTIFFVYSLFISVLLDQIYYTYFRINYELPIIPPTFLKFSIQGMAQHPENPKYILNSPVQANILTIQELNNYSGEAVLLLINRIENYEPFITLDKERDKKYIIKHILEDKDLQPENGRENASPYDNFYYELQKI